MVYVPLRGSLVDGAGLVEIYQILPTAATVVAATVGRLCHLQVADIRTRPFQFATGRVCGVNRKGSHNGFCPADKMYFKVKRHLYLT